jgi:nucleoside-diphosphate-sugar epimerase
MKALVTGGCGFIGSHLVKKLIDNNFSVTVVDDLSSGSLTNLSEKDVSFRAVHPSLVERFFLDAHNEKDASAVIVITGDFVDTCVLSHMLKENYTHIFHLAANPRVEYSVNCPAITTETNLMKTVVLLSACRQTKIEKFIFASSSAVYGDVESLPIRETVAGIPQSPYALQKLSCEMFMQQFSNLYNLDIVALRFFNVYGPGCTGDNPYATAIASWCDKLARKESLRSDGDGTQTRDMVYVDDVSEAMLRFSRDHKGHGFAVANIGTGCALSNNEILETLKSCFPDLVVQHAPERPGDTKHTLASTRKLREYLGWIPQTSFEEGLDKTLKWWKLR